MSNNCRLVVFSNKAYNAIIRESFDKDPVETGGILLGHILDNGVWIVMDVLPPGINSIFKYAYFEYDTEFVNYLAQSVANQYKKPLDLLGLWHRHPGHMDTFSSTDDETNTTFASLNNQGVISGLVNIDPRFRLTMYHMDKPMDVVMSKPQYHLVEVEVGDDIIPIEYFELRYYNGDESDTHPVPSTVTFSSDTENKQPQIPNNADNMDDERRSSTPHKIVCILLLIVAASICTKCFISTKNNIKDFVDNIGCPCTSENNNTQDSASISKGINGFRTSSSQENASSQEKTENENDKSDKDNDTRQE